MPHRLLLITVTGSQEYRNKATIDTVKTNLMYFEASNTNSTFLGLSF